MSTYFDKKKLLDDNKDLYISTYDKSLGTNALSQIIDAKRSYAQAEKNKDTAAMNAANKKANSVRMEHGSYEGGSDGSEFNKLNSNYESAKPKAYSSPYAAEQKNLIKKLTKSSDFEYDPYSDPVFKSYSALYSRLGDEAYDRALSKNSLKTGGMLNSGAQSSAMQAKNRYNSELANIIPKLYELAYSKYNDEFERNLKSLNALSQLDETQYGRYRDEVKDFESDRDYYYNKYKDLSDSLAKRYEFDSELEFDIAKSDAQREYEALRDKADDDYRNKKLEYEALDDKFMRALNLAKALYGKNPISSSVIKNYSDIIG